MNPADCPYRGLQPYTEADLRYFFGRERDSTVIASNLCAAPLTILTGASGVGKTSVLLAGVVPSLRAQPRDAVVVFRAWQDPAFATALRGQVAKELSKTGGQDIADRSDLAFDELLRQGTRAVRGDLFLIFDQFEDYFLYHPSANGEDGFEAELARAVNRPEVRANVLICMREDSLARLDRFQHRIPNLLGNIVRLDHLDRAGAESAVRGPLARYNADRTPEIPVAIEDDLVTALLDQVTAGQVTLDQSGQGRVEPAGVGRDGSGIETPYLQIVLERLWKEQQGPVLQYATLRNLGGALRIVRSHLDRVMGDLDASDQGAAARVLRFLVTPAGTKIALTARELAYFAEIVEEQVKRVLDLLAAEGRRVVRAVRAVDPRDPPRFEIFHDTLAPAILDWRARYVQEQQRAEDQRRLEIERAESEKRAAEQQRQLAQAALLAREQQERFLSEERSARRLRAAARGLGVMSVAVLLAAGVSAYQWRQAVKREEEIAKANAKLEDLARRLKATSDQMEEAKRKAEAQEKRAARALKSLQEAIAAIPDPAVRDLLTKTFLSDEERIPVAQTGGAPSPKPPPLGSAKAREPNEFGLPLWENGSTLRVRFLDGDPEVQEKVATIAREWTVPANIKLAFGTWPDAEVRVSFLQTGTWSLLGTRALSNTDPGEPTMNFGWLTKSTAEAEYRRAVLHEVGHLFGLIHEEQNPNAAIPWNREAFYKEYPFLPRDMIDENLFRKAKVQGYRAFDPKSVMVYFRATKELTNGKLELNPQENTRLSDSDREFIAKLYPP